MDKFIESRPQRLCLMCGKCCRLSTTYITYDELLKMAEEGDKGAKDFLSIFEPYASLEEAIKANPETVKNILKNIDKSNDKVTFYKCKYILDNNLCGIYEKRPELCERFPSSAWAVIPPGCGYEGWIFQYKEELKQKIRKQKESLLDLEVELKKEHTPEMSKKLEDAIQRIKDIVQAYAKYGANDW